MSNTTDHDDDDREHCYRFSGKVEKVYSQRHKYEAEVEIEIELEGESESELEKYTYQGRGSARTSLKAIEKAIKNAGYLSKICHMI